MTDVFLQRLWKKNTEWPRGTKFSYRFYTLEMGDDDVWTASDPSGETAHLCPIVESAYESADDLQAELDRLVDR